MGWDGMAEERGEETRIGEGGREGEGVGIFKT